MTLQEKIDVLEGLKRGETIEFSPRGGNFWVTLSRDSGEIGLNFLNYDYRIKKKNLEPKYVPYNWVDLMKELQTRNGYVKLKGFETVHHIDSTTTALIYIGKISISYTELLDNYIWVNDDICGKLTDETKTDSND